MKLRIQEKRRKQRTIKYLLYKRYKRLELSSLGGWIDWEENKWILMEHECEEGLVEHSWVLPDGCKDEVWSSYHGREDVLVEGWHHPQLVRLQGHQKRRRRKNVSVLWAWTWVTVYKKKFYNSPCTVSCWRQLCFTLTVWVGAVPTSLITRSGIETVVMSPNTSTGSVTAAQRS